MTLITRICLALVLAVTLSLTSLTSAAHAAVFSFPYSPSMSSDSIAFMAQAKSSTRLKDGGIAVINSNRDPLTLSGAYNGCYNGAKWPLSTIPPQTVVVAEFDPDVRPCFAANYQMGQSRGFAQLAVVNVGFSKLMSKVNNQNRPGEYPASELYNNERASLSAGSFGRDSAYVSGTWVDLGFNKKLFIFEVLY